MNCKIKFGIFFLFNLLLVGNAFATYRVVVCHQYGIEEVSVTERANPAYFDAISDQFHVPKENILLITDSPDAIERAEKEQVATIALSYGNYERGSLVKAKPLYICDTDDELDRLLAIPGLSIGEIKKINKELAIEVVDFKALDESARGHLVDEIYAVYSIALKGREKGSFEEVALYDKMNPDSIQVVVWRNTLKKVVGFLVSKRHDLTCLHDNMATPDADNHYAVFKFYVCGLPECAGHGMMEYQKKLFTDYHTNNPESNIVVFEYSVNHKSFKKARYTALFYPFIDQENRSVNSLVEFLKSYFGYKAIDEKEPYVIKATSRPVVEVYLDPEDKLGTFYAHKTAGVPNAGLLFFCCIYLTPNNSMGLQEFRPDFLMNKSNI